MADGSKQVYQWTGVDKQGKRVQGSTEAQDLREAHAELKRMGVEVISLRANVQSSSTGSSKKGLFASKKKVKLKNILLFTRYLGTMLAAGIPILQALDIISQDQENEAMRSFVLTLRANISGGKTLSETFKQYPKYFSDLYSSLIAAGEKSGALDKILKRLAVYLERSEALRAKLKKATIYPATIITVALLASSIMLIFVVPKFQDMFKSFGAQLPLFTRIILAISNFMQSYWWLLLIIIFGAIWSFRYMLRTSHKFRRRIDLFLLNAWIIGPITRKGVIARFSRTLATTLESGMPITDAMRSMSVIMGNAVYSDALNKVIDDVVAGHQLNVSLSSTGLFPNMVTQMIAVGEVSGTLGEMLNKIADYYEAEVNNIVDNLGSLLEPLIMLVLGVVVGSLVVAMYLPIFKLGSLF